MAVHGIQRVRREYPHLFRVANQLDLGAVFPTICIGYDHFQDKRRFMIGIVGDIPQRSVPQIVENLIKPVGVNRALGIGDIRTQVSEFQTLASQT